MRKTFLEASALAIALGCASGGPQRLPERPQAAATALDAAQSAPGRESAPTALAKWKGLPFIKDDFSRALAQARAEGKPLFVDAWAPW
jgi:hypothetical protein